MVAAVVELVVVVNCTMVVEAMAVEAAMMKVVMAVPLCNLKSFPHP